MRRMLGRYGPLLPWLRTDRGLKKMMNHSASILEQANEEIGVSVDRAMGTLAELTIDELGLLLMDVPGTYPALRRFLPTMPADEVQRAWTGLAGVDLLRQSCAFARSVELAFCNYRHRSLKGATILDYGCGWGRLIRLMYHYSPPQKLFGVDPWDQSIELCRSHGLKGNLAICDYVPNSLPFGNDVGFDGRIRKGSERDHRDRRLLFPCEANQAKAVLGLELDVNNQQLEGHRSDQVQGGIEVGGPGRTIASIAQQFQQFAERGDILVDNQDSAGSGH